MGEVFAGRYELIDPIGRGGVGAVWRAWDHRRRRYVAAKVLQQSDAHTLLRFVREQAVRVDHPHVLAPASWAADDDKVLFTMDLVRGGSLAHLIGDYGPLPPRFVCLLLDQLLAGLAAVHGEGVVHRDIKPANVLLEATGTARPHLRLSDFGISMRKGEPRLTDTNFVVGTPGYFAPEQMLGAEPDFPADLFAVGLLALYLLSGERPDSEALVKTFLNHGVPPAPAGVPDPLWQVLASLLQPDPDARFKTATGTRKALAEAAELLPELDPAEEPVEVFDQLGPLPAGFGPTGPERPQRPERPDGAEGYGGEDRPGAGQVPGVGPVSGAGPGLGAGPVPGAGPGLGANPVPGTGPGLGAGPVPAAGPGLGASPGPGAGPVSGAGPGLGASPIPGTDPGLGAGPGPAAGPGLDASPGPDAASAGGTDPAATPAPAGPAGAPGLAGAGAPGPAYAPGAPGVTGTTGHVPAPAGPGTEPPPPQGPAEATSYGIAPPAAAQPPTPTPTAPYTTAQPHPQPHLHPPHPAHPPGVGGAPRRPGPPAKVAVPVAVLAVLLIAAGVWALATG
ncbi:protein kinase domain-containing protein [Streptomyces sp. MAR4 CNX-425]|uniref:serine/threonine-protein kinase n=1 Tax=Streptomyces sp. MAR4 CNX-425 TaxID=3406343 RepID=UPI003B505A70